MSIIQVLGLAFIATGAVAADQTVVGGGNAAAERIASGSQLVKSAKRSLVAGVRQIRNTAIRNATLDAILNHDTCIAHRAGVDGTKKSSIIQQLLSSGLINEADGRNFPGGLQAGVFPPVLNDGSSCPKLPLSFDAAPGSVFGGHHSYPGGLPVHEANNSQSFRNFATLYRGSYGSTGPAGLPVFGGELRKPERFIDEDVVIAAPVWHDWAKSMVFQWNPDGTESAELNFGGNGRNDAWGAPGESRTGAHHILSLAEAMKRRMPPELVITQACAHSAPTSGNEYKVVNWLRAAAIVAQVDPVAAGYLMLDSQKRLRLPALRHIGGDLNANGLPNFLAEYVLHNLSDADFNFSVPAVAGAEALLASLAQDFGYQPSDTTRYNVGYRNVVLANLSAERLLIIYANSGREAVRSEIRRLVVAGILKATSH